jgi:serine/threonine-protein kinase TTK/MPS1
MPDIATHPGEQPSSRTTMRSPPPPALSIIKPRLPRETNQTLKETNQTLKEINQTLKEKLELKTPRIQANAFVRDFKSEYQPRASNRIEHQHVRLNADPSNHIDRIRGVFTKPSRQAYTSVSNKSVHTPAAPHTPAAHTAVAHTPATTHQFSRAYSEPSIKYQVKVNDKTYKVLRKIGAGGSAKVYEGFEPTTYQSVAIKIINIAQADPRTQKSYFNERAILTQLKDCKHVVKIYNSEYKSEIKELVIVMEKGEADLSQVLDYHFKSRERPEVVDGTFIKFHWRGMLLAVNEIHQHGIVHADLKPVNFILVKNQIKLIDFGIASTLDPGGTSVIRDYQIGTINYMAPEALKNRAAESNYILPPSYSVPSKSSNDENNQRQQSAKKTLIRYNSKADIWSLGCILYNFVYGRPPFDKYEDVLSKVQAITNPRHVINFPEINNTHLMNCMKLCLRYNPADRPTAEQLLNHEYLRSDLICISQ